MYGVIEMMNVVENFKKDFFCEFDNFLFEYS
jgi:hypothetical protein